MSDIFFSDLSIPEPDYNLIGVGSGPQVAADRGDPCPGRGGGFLQEER
jgi:hypothetical protein